MAFKINHEIAAKNTVNPFGPEAINPNRMMMLKMNQIDRIRLCKMMYR